MPITLYMYKLITQQVSPLLLTLIEKRKRAFTSPWLGVILLNIEDKRRKENFYTLDVFQEEHILWLYEHCKD